MLDLNPDKVALAATMGADDAAVSWDAEADVIFDFVGSDATLAAAAAQLATGGLLMVVGRGSGTVSFGFDAPAVESWVTTSAWGSVDELREVVALAAAGALTWDVEALPLVEAATAHARLARGDVQGRLVLVPPVT